MSLPYEEVKPGTIGYRIREERLKLGMSEKQFAELISPSSSLQRIRALETESVNPSKPLTSLELKAMASYGVDIQYVLIGQRSTTEASLSPDEAALLDNYRHTPPERRGSLAEVSQVFAASGKAEKDGKAGSNST